MSFRNWRWRPPKANNKVSAQFGEKDLAYIARFREIGQKNLVNDFARSWVLRIAVHRLMKDCDSDDKILSAIRRWVNETWSSSSGDPPFPDEPFDEPPTPPDRPLR